DPDAADGAAPVAVAPVIAATHATTTLAAAAGGGFGGDERGGADGGDGGASAHRLAANGALLVFGGGGLTSCRSVGPAVVRVRWRLDKTTGAKSSGKREGRGQVCARRAVQRRSRLPFGVCRKAALDRERRRHALPRHGTVAISRRDRLSCVFLLEEQSNGDRAYLFDHQT